MAARHDMVLLIQAVMESGNTIDMMDLVDGDLMMDGCAGAVPRLCSSHMNLVGGIVRYSFDGGVLGLSLSSGIMILGGGIVRYSFDYGLFLIGGCFNSLNIGQGFK